MTKNLHYFLRGIGQILISAPSHPSEGDDARKIEMFGLFVAIIIGLVGMVGGFLIALNGAPWWGNAVAGTPVAAPISREKATK